MGILKFQGTQLFDGNQLLDGNQVLITNEKGVVQEIVMEENAGNDVLKLEGIITPGFINAHCHLELSHLRGLIPKHTGLVDFVFTVVTQRHLPEDEIAAAIKTAEDEMLANGIVAVGDICNNTSTLFQKQQGRLAYFNFIEVSGWLPHLAGARFERSKVSYDAFLEGSGIKDQGLRIRNQESGMEHPAAGFQGSASTVMTPHAPYSVSSDLWQLMAPFFAGKTTTIHNQETAFEDDLFKTGTGDFLRMYQKMNIGNGHFTPTGKTSLQSYLPKLNGAKQVLLVHNTFTTEEDVLYASRQLTDISWCLCINANQYIENALPPIDLLRKHSCKMVLGTDSLASNHSLSILDEMKTISKFFPTIPLAEMLQWATSNGARALDMEAKLGSFAKGKQPGVLLLERLEGLRLQHASTVSRLV